MRWCPSIKHPQKYLHDSSQCIPREGKSRSNNPRCYRKHLNSKVYNIVKFYLEKKNRTLLIAAARELEIPLIDCLIQSSYIAAATLFSPVQYSFHPLHHISPSSNIFQQRHLWYQREAIHSLGHKSRPSYHKTLQHFFLKLRARPRHSATFPTLCSLIPPPLSFAIFKEERRTRKWDFKSVRLTNSLPMP